MFKAIGNAVAICLQGTIFERRPKHAATAKYELWAYSFDQEKAPPYVLTQEEYKVKNDIITKHHTTENRLQEKRSENRRARAKWSPDVYEQIYIPPVLPAMNNPQVEIYYRTLGLHLARDARISFTGMVR